jgi:hypothetical protein
MAPDLLAHENETSAEPTVLERYQLRGKNHDVQFVYEASTPNPPDTTVIPEDWNVFGARVPRLI